MTSESIPCTSDVSFAWTFRVPTHSQAIPCLAILCGDWSYGLLPYCGPGRREALWESEKIFLDMFSEYLLENGFFTLSLTTLGESSAIPPDDALTKLAGVHGLLSALKQLNGPAQWNPRQMICIGHGLGGYVHCQLASTGIRPAAFIFTSGVYSDYEVILSQKYFPLNQMDRDMGGDSEIPGPDVESVLIAKNIGVVLHAIRKGRKRIRIENGESPLCMDLDPMIFSGTQMPRDMFRYIASPTLIIHGSADLDASPWNATSIEQSIRQNGVSPERMILAGLDHWFRQMPQKPGDKLMERLNGECFKREPDTQVFEESVSFIKRILSHDRCRSGL